MFVGGFLLVLLPLLCDAGLPNAPNANADQIRAAIPGEVNNYRSHVKFPPTNMMKTTWDSTLEECAQAQAASCTTGPIASSPCNNYAKSGTYLTWTADLTAIKNVFKAWNKTQENYVYFLNQAKHLKTEADYKDYTNLANANHYKIGCGFAQCNDMGAESFVCVYQQRSEDKTHHSLVAGKQKIYEFGENCTDCPTGKSLCYNDHTSSYKFDLCVESCTPVELATEVCVCRLELEDEPCGDGTLVENECYCQCDDNMIGARCNVCGLSQSDCPSGKILDQGDCECVACFDTLQPDWICEKIEKWCDRPELNGLLDPFCAKTCHAYGC